jgi:SAM-dependent methyltransferase
VRNRSRTGATTCVARPSPARGAAGVADEGWLSVAVESSIARVTRPAWLDAQLRCPACEGELDTSAAEVRCRACARVYPQLRADVLSLAMTPDGDVAAWTKRQVWFEALYGEVVANHRESSIVSHRNGFDRLARWLGELRGRVLDVGGGIGIARGWLAADVEYVTVEPSAVWLDARWLELAAAFPWLRTPPVYIDAVAERLPFRDATFDAAMFISSLNHVSDPARSLAEAARVLRPGGRLLLAIDDIQPPLATLRRGGGAWATVLAILEYVRAAFIGTACDHLHFTAGDVTRWTEEAYALREVAWVGKELVFDLERR